MVAGSDKARARRRHDEEHLRRFVAARARGDAAAMREWWEELVIDFADRMDGLVGAAHRGRLDDEEHELAVEMCLVRFSQRLIETFEGVSIGELVNACKALARGICIDVQRGSIRRREHDGPSLDEGWNVARDERRAPRWEADEAMRRFERAERGREARDFLAWALPQLAGDRRRVVELTFDGAEIADITGELGVSRDNAYQLRRRGLRDLETLKERYDA